VYRCRYAVQVRAARVAGPWDGRPYGRAGDRELGRLAERATAQLRHLTEVEGRHRVLHAQAQGGEGPAAGALRERAAAVHAAAAAEAQLPDARARIEQARAGIAAVRARLAELAPLAEQGRLTLRLQGTSRAQAAADLKAARAELAEATQAERAANRRMGELTTQAAAPYPGPYTGGRSRWTEGAAAAESADLTGRWDQHLAAAIADDVGTARQRATGVGPGLYTAARLVPEAAVPRGQHPPATAAQARQRLTAITTEQTIRAALPPRRAAREHDQRAQHATAQARAAQQATRQHAQHNPLPRRGRPGQGPGHRPGRGR
jgi:hypothetical protein